MNNTLLRPAALIVLFAFIALLGFGQAGETGSITGTITDPSGAVAPNAKVTVTNSNTGATRTSVTTDSGNYTFTTFSLDPTLY